MEIRKENEIIAVYDGDSLIETYDFGKEIDFSKLVTHLIGCDFLTKLELKDLIEQKTEQEKNLVAFIQRIVDDYNTKVDKYLAETKE